MLSKISAVEGARVAGRRAALLLSSLALACLAAPVASAAATPLAEYRARVGAARELAESQPTKPAKPGSEEARVAAAEHYVEVAAELRRLLPPSEQVESAGQTVVVNNAWLHTLLDDYEKSVARLSAAEHTTTFERIVERLGALEARLAGAEGAAAQGALAPRDKDAEKGRLAAILQGKEYNREAAEGGALRRLLEQLADAISNLFPDVNPISRGASSRASRVVQFVVIALALAVITYFFRRYWVRRRDQIRPLAPAEARVVLGERIEADRTASDLLTEAELLAREGDLRGAIRKAYVALLCELGDRKIIRLAHHKTNRDYLRDARRDAPPRLYEQMRPLTDGFERHWYGLEEADQSDWADYRTRCREALRAP